MVTGAPPRHWWIRGMIISSAIAIGGTLWLWSQQADVFFNWRGDIIFLAFVVGCIAPLYIHHLTGLTKKIAWVSLTVVLWAGWMFFFNGIALFALPLIVDTVWMFQANGR
ncbi:MAG: hypothetical protein C7B43_20225 [Sulfobacillus benefaciens]|uniref:Uncharacterized protein n=1 Tax=Sulfobacillus benefaciens TaxID=453960 RepID=A0A2T2WM07_9FIRM|nr:MAG: hypothetical protein C7B43_20225 [Sulfobacillus benefaciens]HBQ95675.1 hypothetical protein [Sulfobacillus sp.]